MIVFLPAVRRGRWGQRLSAGKEEVLLSGDGGRRGLTIPHFKILRTTHVFPDVSLAVKSYTVYPDDTISRLGCPGE